MNTIWFAITICFVLGMLTAIAGCHATNPSADLPALGALTEDASKLQPIDAGERAPVVTVRDVNGRAVQMNRVYRDQPTVLVFYRGGWCPFCTQHMAELGAVEADLRDLGFQIVGVSPDRPTKLRESIGEHELTYTLLSDSDATLMRAFGVAFRVDQQTYEMLLGHNMDIEEHSGRSHRVLPVPAVYLIDTDGMIRFAHWDPDYRERLSGDAVMHAAREMIGGK